MKTLPTLVRCSGRDRYDPGVKCVTALGNRSTALSTTCAAEQSTQPQLGVLAMSEAASLQWRTLHRALQQQAQVKPDTH